MRPSGSYDAVEVGLDQCHPGSLRAFQRRTAVLASHKEYVMSPDFAYAIQAAAELFDIGESPWQRTFGGVHAARTAQG